MITLENIKKIDQLVKAPDILEGKKKIEVDNRLLDEDSIFIAIVGAKYNPLNDLEKVVASGCKFVICEDGHSESLDKYERVLSFFIVKDILAAIQELASIVVKEYRSRGGQLIGISGSNGKTTTKEMLTHILKAKYEVISTQKNNNNHLGVPFTLFQINSSTQVAVVELGSNHPGEIETLCKILNPQFGVTTNIGATHLEFFETLEAVDKEESTLAKYSEIFFQNCDDVFLKKREGDVHSISFGKTSEENKFIITKNSIQVNDTLIKNNYITGDHNFFNLGVAFVLADTMSPGFEGFVKAAEDFRPTANRSQWITVGETKVFLDAYNANPSSMKAAILGFVGASSEERVAVLGDMNELGDGAASFHEEIGEFLNQFSFKKIFFVGRFAENYGKLCEIEHQGFSSTEELIKHHSILNGEHKFLFIKGSRSLQLETILDI